MTRTSGDGSASRRSTQSSSSSTTSKARMTASLTLSLEQNAVISACGRYRYLLSRQVGPGLRTATFIMLNPSTADATNDDPTIRRCIGFARQWGCGRLAVLNLFAVRATDPAEMKRADDPVGPENRDWFDRHLLEGLYV